jgi:hypothetical protein
MDAKLTLFNATEGLDQSREVEEVADAFAIGLKEKRKRWIAGCDAKQVVGTLAELPERGTLIGAAAREQQGAPGGLAKTAGEEGSGTKLAQNKAHGFGGFDEDPVGIGGLVGVGKTEDEAVVAPEGFNFGAA